MIAHVTHERSPSQARQAPGPHTCTNLNPGQDTRRHEDFVEVEGTQYGFTRLGTHMNPHAVGVAVTNLQKTNASTQSTVADRMNHGGS